MQKDRLTEYLKAHHLGAEHAVTSRVLETLFDLKGKQLRDIVNALRREGVPIAGLNRSLGLFDKMQTRLPLKGGDEH